MCVIYWPDSLIPSRHDPHPLRCQPAKERPSRGPRAGGAIGWKEPGSTNE